MAPSSFLLITLDLDDTLWPCIPVIRAAEEALHAWLQARAPRLAEAHDLSSLREHRRQLMEARPAIAHDVTLVRRLSLAELLEAFDYPVGLADEAMGYFMDCRNRVEPYDDVVPALRHLAQRYRLVSLTNGNSNVEATPLRGLFAHSLTAAEAGAAKPHPALFQRALELTGCAPAQCLHLGDDPWMDVEPARALGFTAIWVNRAGQTWPDALHPPALTVTDLSQVVTWLTADDGDFLQGDTDGF